MSDELEVTSDAPTDENPEVVTAVVDDSPTSSEDAPAPPKRDRAKERIKGLVKKVSEFEAENRRLQAELQTSRTPVSEKKPERDNFDTFEDYQEAIAEHTAHRVYRETQEKVEKETQKRQQEQFVQTRREMWEAHSEAVAEKYDDGSDILDNFTDIVLSQAGVDVILESELGGDLAYYLGKNDAEAQRISKLSPARQAAELGKLEAKLASEPIKKASKAPAPVDTVTGRSSTANDLPKDSDDSKTWYQKERKRLAALRS